MANELSQTTVGPIQPRENGFYVVTGGTCIVTASRGIDIPRIPGNISADMQLCEVKIPNNISVYLQKKWEDTWKNKKYSQLSKLKVGTGKSWFRWAGSRYNTRLGSFSKEITIEMNQEENINIYMGMNVFYNGCASYAGGGYSNYGGVCNWTLYYKDGSTQTGTFRTARYYGNTGDVGSWNCSEHTHHIITSSKPTLKIVAKFNFNNAWGRFHDIGDRGPNNSAYTGQINEEGTRYFSGDISKFDIFNHFGILPDVGNIEKEVNF